MGIVAWVVAVEAVASTAVAFAPIARGGRGNSRQGGSGSRTTARGRIDPPRRSGIGTLGAYRHSAQSTLRVRNVGILSSAAGVQLPSDCPACNDNQYS